MKRLLPLSALALAISACVATPPLVMGEVAPPLTLPSDEMQVTVFDYTGAPLAGAQVEIDTLGTIDLVETDEAGNAVVKWNEAGISLTIDGPAHDPQTVAVEQIPDNEDLEVRLSATVLNGLVTGVGGNPLPGATVTLDGQTAMTGPDGAFQMVAVEPGDITVERAAYMAGSTSWSGAGPATVGLEPFIVRGIYVHPSLTGSGERWQEILDLVETTEVNTLVIDIKDETGRVFIDTGVPMVDEVGAANVTYDATAVLAEADALGAYLIGRVVTFQDPIAAQARPDLAILDTTNGQPYEKNGQYFLDPTDPNAQRYALDLAVAACEAGISEIQFDYVRYPDGLSENTRFDGTRSDEGRPQVIADFLATAQSELHPLGCAVSADIFGFITRAANDGGIGQQLEMIAGVTDAVSPMIYPSHYSTGWYGFEVPNDHPGPMIASAMDDGLERIEGDVIFRPWLQDFWYDASQVRAEIDAAEARDAGWLLWHPGSIFTEGALGPAG